MGAWCSVCIAENRGTWREPCVAATTKEWSPEARASGPQGLPADLHEAGRDRDGLTRRSGNPPCDLCGPRGIRDRVARREGCPHDPTNARLLQLRSGRSVPTERRTSLLLQSRRPEVPTSGTSEFGRGIPDEQASRSDSHLRGPTLEVILQTHAFGPACGFARSRGEEEGSGGMLHGRLSDLDENTRVAPLVEPHRGGEGTPPIR